MVQVGTWAGELEIGSDSGLPMKSSQREQFLRMLKGSIEYYIVDFMLYKRYRILGYPHLTPPVQESP